MTAPRRSIDQFKKQMADIDKQADPLIREEIASIIDDAYTQVVIGSPVRTGAYRGEHIIATGSRFIYENPERVGPTEEVEGPVPPPNLEAARTAMRSESKILPEVTILNQRFYADQIENGSSSKAPNGVYAVAALKIQSRPDRELLIKEQSIPRR